jgi:hypothetical protein
MIIVETRNELLDLLPINLTICEIGVFKGEFSKILLDKMKPKELHLIDIFEGQMCSGDKDGNNIVWTNLNDEYLKLIELFKLNENVFIHKGMSYSILENFDDEFFDLIYVDGDHSYNGVKKDLEVSFRKIKNNGFILGHDYTPQFQGVIDAVNEFCLKYKQSISMLTKDGCPTFVININKT